MSSGHVVKASLVTLPTELMNFIIPNPTSFKGVNVKDSHPYDQEWLGLEQKYERFKYEAGPSRMEAAQTLRALSQTCTRLRDLTLPLIWAVVHVATVDELGRLRELMRAVPSIAAHVRSFCFLWDMDGDYFRCNAYTSKEAGSLLDLAFADRQDLWERLMFKYNCEMMSEGGGEESLIKWFTHEGRQYLAPGRPVPIEGEYEDEECYDDEYSYEGDEFPIYDPDDPNEGGVGPDGNGVDKLIKDPQQFCVCVSEVVSQLKNLVTFGWSCPVTPMPTEAFNSLSDLQSLKFLHLTVAAFRDQVHGLPYWKLTHSLQELSFDFDEVSFSNIQQREVKGVECDEAVYASFEVPSELPTTREAINTLTYAVASRTIIAAARGGSLKRLNIGRNQVQPPFAIRALLPFWVGIEDWGSHSAKDEWVQAALDLRPLLAHSSLWLDASQSPREDRRLTRQEVQGLHSYYKKSGLPKLAFTYWTPIQTVDRYTLWLEEEQLAGQVADAWNAVVKLGEADKVKCCCDRCVKVHENSK